MFLKLNHLKKKKKKKKGKWPDHNLYKFYSGEKPSVNVKDLNKFVCNLLCIDGFPLNTYKDEADPLYWEHDKVIQIEGGLEK